AADQRALREVVAVERRDVLLVGEGDGLLRLNHLDVARDSGSEPVPRLRQLLIGEIAATRRDLELLDGRLQIEISAPDLVIDRRLEIVRLIAPVPQIGIGLEQTATRPPALEDRNLYGTHHGK